MLGWLTNQFTSAQEAAGPLGSAKAARALLTELDAETPQYAVKELAKHLKDAPQGALESPRGLDALQEIDEWAQRPLAELWKSVIGDSQGLTVSEANWDTLTQYYRRSYLSYWTCHQAHSGPDSSQKRDQAKAVILAARAMAAAARYMLVLRLRYINAPNETWPHLWNLIGWSDERGIATQAIELYPGGVKTTIERELLTAMLVEVAPTAGLLPGQMLALDDLLRLHAHHYKRSDQYDARATPFVYDPSRSAPPQRWLDGLKVRPELRFFGAAGAYLEVSHARADRKHLRSSLQGLTQTRCSAASYAQLLDRVVAEWSPDPPRRRHRREVCSGDILVAHDLAAIRRLVKFSELALSGQSLAYDSGHAYKMNGVMATGSDRSFSRPHGGQAVSAREALANLLVFEKTLDPAATDTWTLNDSSESGIGATAERDCAWIKVGMAIAFRQREGVEWKVALVRRLERSMNGRLSIGMSLVCGKVSSARLRPGIGRLDYGSAASRNEAAIEYAALVVRDAAATVLLPIGLFDATQKYTLSCEDRHHVVKMEKTVEAGPNFERIEISEVEMQCAA